MYFPHPSIHQSPHPPTIPESPKSPTPQLGNSRTRELATLCPLQMSPALVSASIINAPDVPGAACAARTANAPETRTPTHASPIWINRPANRCLIASFHCDGPLLRR